MEIKIENLKDFLLKLTQEDIEELMKRTEKEEDRIFYNKLFNLILETKQEELIKNLLKQWGSVIMEKRFDKKIKSYILKNKDISVLTFD